MKNRRILGSGPQAQLLEKFVQQGAAVSIPVLVCGERGAGREFVARLLHEESGRAGLFVALNCAGLSEAVLGDEARRCLGVASGGTFFLDNIEDAPLTLQPELARLALSLGVRFVGATTASNVDERVDSGLFGMRIFVAPLRERQADIPIMVGHFTKEFAEQYQKPVRGVQPLALWKLVNYSWPGNVRELRDAVERAVTTTTHELLGLEDFAFLVAANEFPLQFMIPGATIHQIEKEAILRTLEHAGGSTALAARMLKMSVRKVQYKLKQYRIADEVAETQAKGAAGG